MTTDLEDVIEPESSPQSPGASPRWCAAAGAISALFTLGFGYLLAAWYEEHSPVDNVATAVIGHAPHWLVEIGKSWFGTNDKVALGIGVVIITTALGAAVGRAGARRPLVVWVAYAVLAFVGFVAVLDRPDTNTVSAAVVLVVSALAGVGVYFLLRYLASLEQPVSATAGSGEPRPDRRWFLGVAAGVVVVAAASASRARTIMNQVAVAARNAVGLPVPSERAPAVPASASLSVPGLEPIVTPNSEFYKIDTAFVTPRVDPADWELSVGGLVDEPFTLSYDELLNMPMVERYLTLACVSNEVGGDLISNAKWLGVPLAEVLDRAKPRGDAEQVVGRSVDGFTAGFPIELASDGREAMVAVGMNEEPLPFDHGFPARLVVEGLYGYVSATKWLREIELTTWDGFDGYWIPRGWSKLGPIKTQSRIDVPRTRAVPAGPTVIAGVAWAQNRGIDKVEVRVDDQPWQEAQLADAISDATWVQWMLTVDLAVGEHTLTVRATDETPETQTEERSRPDPNGATGWHSRTVEAAQA